jgi:hypothetical protein
VGLDCVCFTFCVCFRFEINVLWVVREHECGGEEADGDGDRIRAT